MARCENHVFGHGPRRPATEARRRDLVTDGGPRRLRAVDGLPSRAGHADHRSSTAATAGRRALRRAGRRAESGGCTPRMRWHPQPRRLRTARAAHSRGVVATTEPRSRRVRQLVGGAPPDRHAAESMDAPRAAAISIVAAVVATRVAVGAPRPGPMIGCSAADQHAATAIDPNRSGHARSAAQGARPRLLVQPRHSQAEQP